MHTDLICMGRLEGRFKNGQCLDLDTITYVYSAIKIAQDVVILLLPVSWLAGLNMALRKKLNIFGMFSLRIIIIMSSVIRLPKVIPLHDSRNPTWDYVDTIYWTAIETYISILVPNLPAIRSYLTHLFPNLFGLGMTSDNIYKYERIDAQRTQRKNSRRPKSWGDLTGTLNEIALEDVEVGEGSKASGVDVLDESQGRGNSTHVARSAEGDNSRRVVEEEGFGRLVSLGIMGLV